MSASELLFSQPPLAGAPALVFGESDALPVAPVAPSDPRALVFQTLVADVADLRALVFGAETADVAPPVGIADVTLQASGCITGLRGHITLRAGAVVQASGQLSGLRGHLAIRTAAVVGGAVRISGMRGFIAAAYDNRVMRWLGQPVVAPQQKAASVFVETGSAWRVSLPRRDALALPWKTARETGAALDLPFASAVPRRQALAVPWQSALLRHRQAAAAHQKAAQHDIRHGAGWQLAERRSIELAVKLQAGLWRDARRSGGWRTAILQAHDLSAPSGASLRLVGVQFMAAPWAAAVQPRNGRSVLPVVMPFVNTPRDGRLVFDLPSSMGSANLVFGVAAWPCGRAPLPAARVVVAIKRIYMVLNEVSLRRVDGNIPLPTSGMTLNLDADSWAWGFSASLPGGVLQDLEPASYGAPVELEALVNGTAFRVLVEGITRQRTFGKSDISVSGRGKTALLDGPYAPVRNFSNASARTAQQLMADVLSINGVAMDWEIDWQLDDWLVPAGVFTHQGSHISALNAIAAAAGGYIQPHASLQILRVLPRYPSAPWDWPAMEQAGTLIPDFELPAAVTTREGIEWVERARYNRVFVSGQQSGILGQVTRAGTAGDLLAPMIVDPLITTASAARQRGLSVLGNTGRQANITLGLPVLPETGVILPGGMVRYTDAGVSRLGIARSVSLAVGYPEVWQSIGVETHV